MEIPISAAQGADSEERRNPQPATTDPEKSSRRSVEPGLAELEAVEAQVFPGRKALPLREHEPQLRVDGRPTK